jgi:hypothetical protein
VGEPAQVVAATGVGGGWRSAPPDTGGVGAGWVRWSLTGLIGNASAERDPDSETASTGSRSSIETTTPN